MKKYQSVIWGALLIAAIIGFIFLIVRSGNGALKDQPPKPIASGAYAELTEYGDFQCPACAQYYPIIKQLLNDYGSQIHFIFKNFPLSQHPNAKPAAYAAEAARNQGKFMEMMDLIYPNHYSWANSASAQDIFLSYAKSLNLNLDQFKKDAASSNISSKVQNEYNEGLSLGVNATPTFLVNGQKIEAPQGYNDFKKIIDNVLKP